MKKIALIIFMLQLSTISFSQINLVPNPSFEQYDTCPDSITREFGHAVPWTNPTNASPDYYNACNDSIFGVPGNLAGHENARTGQAYAGIITDYFAGINPNFYEYREYIQVKLLNVLEPGTKYFIKFYVSAGDSERYISNDFGVFFSQYEIQDTAQAFEYNLPFIPQIVNNNNLVSRNGWTEVSGYLVASGGEQYILIGNFKDHNSTVSTITGWSNSQIRKCTYYYIDDVCVSTDSNSCNENTSINNLTMPNVFTPNGDQKNDKFIPLGENKTLPGTLKIFNRWGQIIFTSDNIYEGWDGGNSDDGVYYWELTYTDLMEKNHRNNGYVILLRNE